MISSWNGTICTSSITANRRAAARGSAAAPGRSPASTPKTTVPSSTPPVKIAGVEQRLHQVDAAVDGRVVVEASARRWGTRPRARCPGSSAATRPPCSRRGTGRPARPGTSAAALQDRRCACQSRSRIVRLTSEMTSTPMTSITPIAEAVSGLPCSMPVLVHHEHRRGRGAVGPAAVGQQVGLGEQVGAGDGREDDHQRGGRPDAGHRHVAERPRPAGAVDGRGVVELLGARSAGRPGRAG